MKKTFFISHGIRGPKLILNFYQAYKLLKIEKPNVIISTGASIAVPVSIIGKFFFKSKIIYIETFARINKPSLTGRIMYFIADKFYFHWKELNKYFPKGNCLNFE